MVVLSERVRFVDVFGDEGTLAQARAIRGADTMKETVNRVLLGPYRWPSAAPTPTGSPAWWPRASSSISRSASRHGAPRHTATSTGSDARCPARGAVRGVGAAAGIAPSGTAWRDTSSMRASHVGF